METPMKYMVGAATAIVAVVGSIAAGGFYVGHLSGRIDQLSARVIEDARDNALAEIEEALKAVPNLPRNTVVGVAGPFEEG